MGKKCLMVLCIFELILLLMIGYRILNDNGYQNNYRNYYKTTQYERYYWKESIIKVEEHVRGGVI